MLYQKNSRAGLVANEDGFGLRLHVLNGAVGKAYSIISQTQSIDFKGFCVFVVRILKRLREKTVQMVLAIDSMVARGNDSICVLGARQRGAGGGPVFDLPPSC